MPITIIVEDGSGVENANSYIDLEAARNYALNRGVVLPANDDELAAMLIKSTDYLESQACRFQGYRTDYEQSLEWPRSEVYIKDNLLPPNSIPILLKNAQAQLVIEISKGFELQPTVSPQNYVKREKVGPLETEYSDPSKISIMPIFTAVNALLAPLFGECASNKFKIRTMRV